MQSCEIHLFGRQSRIGWQQSRLFHEPENQSRCCSLASASNVTCITKPNKNASIETWAISSKFVFSSWELSAFTSLMILDKISELYHCNSLFILKIRYLTAFTKDYCIARNTFRRWARFFLFFELDEPEKLSVFLELTFDFTLQTPSWKQLADNPDFFLILLYMTLRLFFFF